jgi:hypothetical protein
VRTIESGGAQLQSDSRFFDNQSRCAVRSLDADLVVLRGDPFRDVKELAAVAYAVQGGKVIYRASPGKPGFSSTLDLA